MADTRTQLISAMFKPTEGGNVFRAPPPFWVWPTRFYLVTEQQKDQLAAVAVPRHVAIWQVAFLIIVIFGAPTLAGLTVWATTGHDSPTTADIGMLFILSFLLMFGAALARRWWLVWKLAPMLAVLPRTDAGFSLKEMRERAYGALSVRQLAFISVLNVVTATIMVMTGLLKVITSKPDGFIYLGCAVVFSFVAAIYLKRLLWRAEATKG